MGSPPAQGAARPSTEMKTLHRGERRSASEFAHHTTSHMGMAAAVRPALILAHPPTPARIKAAAAMANTLVLRIGILLSMPRSVAVRPERGARRGHRGRVRGRSERRDRNQRRQRESSDKRFHVTSPCLNMSSRAYGNTLDAFCMVAMSPPIFFVSSVSTCVRHAPKTAVVMALAGGHS